MQIKYKKIRGYNRRRRAIQDWKASNQNLDIQHLEKYHYDYVKFWVSPWSRISLTNSVYPEPEGELKKLLIEGLLSIYQSWNTKISQYNQNYYLNVWLFENSISRSQIVCAIKDKIEYYNTVFEPVDKVLSIENSLHFSSETADLLNCFQWKLYRCLEPYDLADKDDIAYIATLPQSQLIRKVTINNRLYQLVESDKVWLIENNAADTKKAH